MEYFAIPPDVVLAVDMFAIFSLRRPDILPVGEYAFTGLAVKAESLKGDLGVQRGIVVWFISLHSPSHNYTISPEKVGGKAAKKKAKDLPTKSANEETGEEAEGSSLREEDNPESPDISSALPVSSTGTAEQGLATLPPPFTPSLKKTLQERAADDGLDPAPLPESLSVSILKSRLDGKKIKYVVNNMKHFQRDALTTYTEEHF